MQVLWKANINYELGTRQEMTETLMIEVWRSPSQHCQALQIRKDGRKATVEFSYSWAGAPYLLVL